MAFKPKTPKRVYIAGPLFNSKEREEAEEIAEIVERAGYRTYVPHRDGCLYRDVIKELKAFTLSKRKAEKLAQKAIFLLDFYQVTKKCDMTVFNMNGRVPDEGGIVEAVLAYAYGKGLVIYKQDARTLIDGIDNPMLTGLTDFEIVTDIKWIPHALRKVQRHPVNTKKRMELARQLILAHSRNNSPYGLARFAYENFP